MAEVTDIFITEDDAHRAHALLTLVRRHALEFNGDFSIKMGRTREGAAPRLFIQGGGVLLHNGTAESPWHQLNYFLDRTAKDLDEDRKRLSKDAPFD